MSFHLFYFKYNSYTSPVEDYDHIICYHIQNLIFTLEATGIRHVLCITYNGQAYIISLVKNNLNIRGGQGNNGSTLVW